ncbi:MazG nucleotide pyrophosphohydrolase domain-containing protein [Methermicoccus shengliensis]|uniref:Nucleotide pyrophosphohydrolase n=1 Tax=Methermicoccus shengliensis TaxID=660064 RepID=A0A832RTH3_9EURY|nr:MazG nucleotide pyrophosphohydrolase domain-containing protein [Methermicoccus shengliensis]HIH70183.1 nucleotide pyrophosphohydrolase [Methermicoccus shengliensis]
MHISELQRVLAERYLEKDGQMGELFLLAVLMEEVGELSKAMRYHEGVAEEMADVMFVCLCLANLLDIDVEAQLIDRYVKRSFEDVSSTWEDVSWK